MTRRRGTQPERSLDALLAHRKAEVAAMEHSGRAPAPAEAVAERMDVSLATVYALRAYVREHQDALIYLHKRGHPFAGYLVDHYTGDSDMARVARAVPHYEAALREMRRIAPDVDDWVRVFGWSKSTVEQVKTMRHDTPTIAEWARAYGVEPRTVSRALASAECDGECGRARLFTGLEARLARIGTPPTPKRPRGSHSRRS